MQRLKEKLLSLLPLYTLLCFSFLWLWHHRDIYFDPYRTLPRDNLKHHLPMLVYVSNYLHLFKTFPEWLYSYEGGVWLSALSNNFLVLMPHRLLAAFIAAFTDWHPNLIYKTGILGGQFFFCLGLYRLSRLFFSSLWVRVGTVLFSLTSAITLTFTYQEHALGTLFYIPWLWICLLRLKHSYSYAFPFLTLLGLSLNNHYPQLLFIYILVLIVASLSELPETREFFSVRFTEVRKSPARFWILSIMAFFVSASPLFYSYTKYHDKLESPFRLQKDGIASNTYQEYEVINTALTKLHPANLKLYLQNTHGSAVSQTALDESITFMGPLMAFVLFGLVFLKIPLKRFHLFMVLGLTICSCGTHTWAPRILWWLVPGITLFRQWIFLLLFLNLQLLFLTFVVGTKFLEWKIESRCDKGIVALGILLFVLATCFQWLPPLSSIPALILLLAKALPLPQKKRALSYVFYVWLVVGTVTEASLYLDHLREFLNYWKASHLYPSRTEGTINNSLAHLRGTYRQFVARPKEITKLNFNELNRFGDLFFTNADGEYTTVPPNAIWFEKTAIRLTNNSRFRYLVFPQLDDGEWLAKTDSILPLRSVKANTAGTWFKIPSGARQIEIFRKKSLWSYLIYIMWVPLLGFGVTVLLKKISVSPKKICFDMAFRNEQVF